MAQRAARHEVALPNARSGKSQSTPRTRGKRGNVWIVAASVALLCLIGGMVWTAGGDWTAAAAKVTNAHDAASKDAARSVAAAPVSASSAAAPSADQADQSPPAADLPPPPLVAEPAVIDLGLVPPRSTREGTAMVRNPTSEPLKIREVRSSCKCTTTEPYLNHVLGPGEAIPVKAVYKAEEKTGTKSQTLYVRVEGWDAPLQIPVKAEVILPVRVTPSRIMFFTEEGHQPNGVLALEAVDGKPFRILSSGGQAPVHADDFKDGDPPRTKYEVRYDVSKDVTPNHLDSKMPWYWVIETDHPDAPLLDIHVRSMQTSWTNRKEFWPPGTKANPRRWSIVPNLRSVAGVFEPGESKEILIEFERGDGLKLTSVQPKSTEIIADAAIIGTVEADDKTFYKVRVTPKSDVRGPFQGVIVFTASDNNVLGHWVIGTVR